MGKSRLIVFLIVLLQCVPLYAANGRSASREYRTANALFASSRFPEALTKYRNLLKSPPRGVPLHDIYTRLGDTYFKLGSFQNALGAYRLALAGQSESERPATQYWIGFCCFLLGRNAEAVDEFLKIPALYPDAGMWIGTAYYWAGRASERLGKTDEAREYYRKAGGNGRSTEGKFALKRAKAVDRSVKGEE